MGQQGSHSDDHFDGIHSCADDSIECGSEATVVSADGLVTSATTTNSRTSRVDKLIRRAQQSLGVKTRGGRDRSKSPASYTVNIRSSKRRREDSDSAASSCGTTSIHSIQQVHNESLDADAVDLSFDGSEILESDPAVAEPGYSALVDFPSPAAANKCKDFKTAVMPFAWAPDHRAMETRMLSELPNQTDELGDALVWHSGYSVEEDHTSHSYDIGSVYGHCVAAGVCIEGQSRTKVSSSQQSSSRLAAIYLAQEVRPPELGSCLGIACASDLGLSPIDEMTEAASAVPVVTNAMFVDKRNELECNINVSKSCSLSTLSEVALVDKRNLGSESSIYVIASDSLPPIVRAPSTELSIDDEANFLSHFNNVDYSTVESELSSPGEDVFTDETLLRVPANPTKCNHEIDLKTKSDDNIGFDEYLDPVDHKFVDVIDQNVPPDLSKSPQVDGGFIHGKSMSLNQLNNSAGSDKLSQAASITQHKTVEVLPFVATSRLMSSSGVDATLTKRKPYLRLSSSPSGIESVGSSDGNATCIESPIPFRGSENGSHYETVVDSSQDALQTLKMIWTEWEHALASSCGNSSQASSPSEKLEIGHRRLRYPSESAAPLEEISLPPSLDQSVESSIVGKASSKTRHPSRSMSQISLNEVISLNKTVPDRLDFWKLDNFEGNLLYNQLIF